jgi:ABC-type spermidine/putrescine transport system permease subunit I
LWLAPRAGLLPLILFLAAFFVCPLVVNLIQSFAGGGLALEEYRRIFTDAYYLSVILHTLLLGAAVTLACLVLGYPLGIVIAKAAGFWKTFMIFAVVAPLLVNVVVRSLGWMIILGGQGAVNWALSVFGISPIELMYTWWGIGIALVHVLAPFMVLSIASVLEGMDPAIEEAAKVLGATRFDTFRLIVLPLSAEGMLTGSILVFTATVGSFVTVMLLGSTSTMVMPLLIYQQLTVASDWAFAAAMGTTLLLLVTIVLWLQSRFTRPRWRLA